MEAIKSADEVHIYWNSSSKGTLFDIGMTFALGKQVKLINAEDVELTPHKSFQNVLHVLNGMYDQ